jgi:hypothetical protein
MMKMKTRIETGSERLVLHRDDGFGCEFERCIYAVASVRPAICGPVCRLAYTPKRCSLLPPRNGTSVYCRCWLHGLYEGLQPTLTQSNKHRPVLDRHDSPGAKDRPTKYNMVLPKFPSDSKPMHRWVWRLPQRRSSTQVRFSYPHIAHIAHTPHVGITYDAIEAAFVGYVFGASTCGQAALYQLGLTGIPITNVNNNCSTGSTALVHAATLVRAGEARCALALGFERMAPGALGAGPAGNPWSDRPSPIGPLMVAAARASPGADRGPPNPRLFGAAATEYFELYGGGVEHLAKIGEPNSTSHLCAC